jgi:hypothetical protein
MFFYDPEKANSLSSKTLFFLSKVTAYFCQNLRHGATKEAKGFILANIPCGHRGFDFCNLHALGMVNFDTSFSNHCLCEGDGYNVT